MYVIILQMPAGGKSAGSKFTRAWDSTVGVGASFYWLAAAFLLVIVIGAVKAYRDDKKWEGKKMDIIYKAARRLAKDRELVVRSEKKKKQFPPL